MQHSNHRTAALIASKPARIITRAALAVALTATPMLSPVAAYAATGESIGVAVSATASTALVMIRAGFDAMNAAVR